VDFEKFLRGLFRAGSLEVILPGGRRLRVGDTSPPEVIVSIADRLALARIVARPSLGVGEAYMDGRLTLERGSLHDLLDLASRNLSSTRRSPSGRPKRPSPLKVWWTRVAREHNARRAARRNVARHYDLSVEFYRKFLDDDLQYSCALFERPGMSLEAAQSAKKRHIAAKLDLSEGQTVLDIGCGWGGLALSLATLAGVKVHGVTLSREQLETATARAAASGLSDRVSFDLRDYRDVEGRYDRIVSVGMFEHVGRPNYQAFFDMIAARLSDDGIALVHSIGRAEGPSTTDPFTAKWIFPGGYIPALSEVLPAIERSGLWLTDVEILRFHYADTLRCWLDRFMSRRAEVAALYDERFCRMWEFYLAGAEMGFRYGGHMNFQLQLARRADAVPITRDYIAQNERALTARIRKAA
jgi:cyclopropane-fatty-acyl-phospholipid synthase